MRVVKKKILLFLACILSILGCSVLPESSTANASNTGNFWVEFVDVGQGDCALIQCDDHYMMIDGGPSNASSTVFTVLKNKGIKNIDIMIATHPDEDHIGGLSGALNYSKVDTILSPVTTHDTKTFNNLVKYVGKQGKELTVPKNGDTYYLGSAIINIIGPVYSSDESNNNSIVVKITYGSTSFMFTGDAEEDAERAIIKKYKGLDCDVLKVGHHGSNSSTSKAWLNATKPEYAVISVGKNSYGHPTQETIDKLVKAGSTIYRTDLQGDITFYSDGKKLSVETGKNATSNELTAGEGNKKTEESKIDNGGGASAGTTFVLNTNSKKFHKPTCTSVDGMSTKNRQDVNMSRDAIVAQGYDPCKRCKP